MTVESALRTIVPRNGLVHVGLGPRFEISLDSMRVMWGDVLPICERDNCRRVLVEGEGPSRVMDKTETFEHGRIVVELCLCGLQGAFCLYDYEPDHLSYLFTTIANGSFNSARFFNDVRRARRWLRH